MSDDRTNTPRPAIAIARGDGIGPEIIDQAKKVLDEIKSKTSSADEAAKVVLSYLF